MNRLERQSYDMETLLPMDKEEVKKRRVSGVSYKP